MAPGTVWTPEEDEKLRELVHEHGEKKWSHISSMMGSKTSKQCRRRWLNHLNMEPKKCGWTPEEDRLLLEYHSRLGNKWTEIAKAIGGRTDNAVKNRYHALARRDEKVRPERVVLDGDGTHFLNQEKFTGLRSYQFAGSRNLEQNTSLEKVREEMRERHQQHRLEQARLNALSSVDAMEMQPHRERPNLKIVVPCERPAPVVSQIWVPMDRLSAFDQERIREINRLDDVPLQINLVSSPDPETQQMIEDPASELALTNEMIHNMSTQSQHTVDEDVEVEYLLQSLKSVFTPKGSAAGMIPSHPAPLDTPQPISAPMADMSAQGLTEAHRDLLARLFIEGKRASFGPSHPPGSTMMDMVAGTSSSAPIMYYDESVGSVNNEDSQYLPQHHVALPSPHIQLSPNFSQVELESLLSALSPTTIPTDSNLVNMSLNSPSLQEFPYNDGDTEMH